MPPRGEGQPSPAGYLFKQKGGLPVCRPRGPGGSIEDRGRQIDLSRNSTSTSSRRRHILTVHGFHAKAVAGHRAALNAACLFSPGHLKAVGLQRWRVSAE